MIPQSGEKSHLASFTVSQCLSFLTNSTISAATSAQEEEDECVKTENVL